MSGSPSRRSRRVAEMRARKERLRAAGIEPNDLFASAAKELRRVTPPGWGNRKVVPPWAGTAGGCRACGEASAKIVTMLTRKLPSEMVVLYTFATVCSGCLDDLGKMQELGERAFAVQ